MTEERAVPEVVSEELLKHLTAEQLERFGVYTLRTMKALLDVKRVELVLYYVRKRRMQPFRMVGEIAVYSKEQFEQIKHDVLS